MAAFLRQTIPDEALGIIETPFETAALPEAAFTLGLTATAFHWLDENHALTKVARLRDLTGLRYLRVVEARWPDVVGAGARPVASYTFPAVVAGSSKRSVHLSRPQQLARAAQR
jgi:hypothetical protein